MLNAAQDEPFRKHENQAILERSEAVVEILDCQKNNAALPYSFCTC